MSPLKPYQRIASRFQVSQESGKYFLNHIQKSFKVERPSHALILEFIEKQNLEIMLTPYEVAALMHEKGAWAYALGSPPPILESNEDDLSDWND